jgi:hypothetical protein
MSDYNLASVKEQSRSKARSKRVSVKPETSSETSSQPADVREENLDTLVEQFTQLDAELKRSATEVDALKRRDLGTVVQAAQVVYKARSRKRKEYSAFCTRVGLEGSRKRRYGKMGERADRLYEIIDDIKNESVAYEIARLAKPDYDKLKASGKLTKEMTKRTLEEVLGRKRPVRSVFTLRLPQRHSICVEDLCAKLTEVVKPYPGVHLKGTGAFEQFSR